MLGHSGLLIGKAHFVLDGPDAIGHRPTQLCNVVTQLLTSILRQVNGRFGKPTVRLPFRARLHQVIIKVGAYFFTDLLGSF